MKRIIWFVAIAMQVTVVLHGAAEDKAVRLGVTQFKLRENDRVVGTAGTEPFVVQFRKTPDAMQREALRARGVTLDTYAGDAAYVVRCAPACISWLPDDASVRASARLSPEMKRSRVFDTDAGLAGKIRDGLPLELDIAFFEGTSFERAAEILRESGIDVKQKAFGFRSSIAVETTWRRAFALLGLPEVRWIEPALPEAVPATINAGERTRVDHVREQYEFLGADGAGTKVGIWDWFPNESHTDLEDRVTWVNVIPGQLAHGEYVSGIVAGAGLLDHRAKGMAPKAEIYWHTCERSTAWADMRATKSRYGITISNNSWGVPITWWADPGATIPSWVNNPWAWGYYHELAAGADELVRNDDLLVVFAAGNARGYGYLGPHYHSGGRLVEDVHPPNPEYGSVAGPAIGKNVLSVGWVTKDEVVTLGSVWGPTNDGRIKPDVVAPGLDLFITDENDGYTMAGGSSLSSPVVAGSAALLTDYWRRRHGLTPTSLELKNLLIHAARDLGNPGPDYVYGFGLIDVELAARIVDAASFAPQKAAYAVSPGARRHGVRRPEGGIPPSPSAMFHLGDLDDDQAESFQFVVRDSSVALRATLAWHDPAGDQLVNDIDLRLVGPGGSVVLPFVMNPSSPSAPASRGRNTLDNVESVIVEHPAVGTWTVVVEGTRVAMAPQRYSLIVSAVGENAPLLLYPEGKCEIFDFFVTKDNESAHSITPETRFTSGDPLNVYFALGIPENADYGDYYGSIAVVGSMTNAQGEVIVGARNHTHQVPSIDRFETVGTGLTIPPGLPRGAYEGHLSVRLHNGRECTASTSFSVE